MRIRFSKEISELEEKEIKYIWQKPDIYEGLKTDDIWLIYGRKGSGKSTIVDYLEKQNHDRKVVIIRPEEDDIFKEAMTTILADLSINAIKDERLIEEGVISTLEFLFLTKAADAILPDIEKKFLRPGSDLEKMYNFFVANKMSRGSIISRAIDIVCEISDSEKMSIIPNFARLLNKKVGSVTFKDFKQALFGYLKSEDTKLLICLDDIDGIGFSFSPSDRLFVDSIIALGARSNIATAKNQRNLSYLIAIPSEVFFHSRLYGEDWVDTKTECLSWVGGQSLVELVNKRIAVEFNIKKKQPRYDGDIYSIESANTWASLFPPRVYNKLGSTEPTFSYILRHTFYTPRHLLTIIDDLLKDIEVNEKKLSTIKGYYDEQDWSRHFQTIVENFTLQSEKVFSDTFSKLYDGFEELLEKFQSRPNIWMREMLLAYFRENEIFVVRKDDKEIIQGESLVYLLQRLGMLGLAVRKVTSDRPPYAYNLRFSFMEKQASRKPWEIAVICPLFYDAHNILPFNNSPVIPHEPLMLGSQDFQKLSSYNHKNNVFLHKGRAFNR